MIRTKAQSHKEVQEAAHVAHYRAALLLVRRLRRQETFAQARTPLWLRGFVRTHCAASSRASASGPGAAHPAAPASAGAAISSDRSSASGGLSALIARQKIGRGSWREGGVRAVRAT